jgi:transposase-like protein
MIRRSPEEKREIIHIVEQSQISVNRNLQELDVPRSTFYRWYRDYLYEGETGLQGQPGKPVEPLVPRTVCYRQQSAATDWDCGAGAQAADRPVAISGGWGHSRRGGGQSADDLKRQNSSC